MAAPAVDAQRAKEKFDRYEDLIEHLSQNLGKSQQSRMVLRLHKTEVLFEQCVTLAEQLNRPAVFQELYSALDQEEPKLLARVEKPKKGLTRLPILFERKLKKYSKRVDDKINDIHQRLAPLRQRHVPHVPHDHHQQQQLTLATSRQGKEDEQQGREGEQLESPIQRNLTTQTSFAHYSDAALEEEPEEEKDEREIERERNQMAEEASVRSELECDQSMERDTPFQKEDSLLYASTSIQAASSSPSLYDDKKKRQDTGPVLGSTKKVAPRSTLKDISNKNKGTKKGDRSKGAKKTGVERVAHVEEESAPEIRGRGRGKVTTSIAILLSACDFLEEDVEQEPYLTCECVEMILNAGELISKGWNDPSLLKKSFELFKMAALEGSIVAARCVGLFYRTGMSVEADLSAALKWFSLGADSGDAISCFMLGDLYEFGLDEKDGASVDLAKASQYYSRFHTKSASGSGLMVSKLLAETSGFNNQVIIQAL